MAENEEKKNPLEISEEEQREAKQAVESAFRDLSTHVRQITEEVSEFNRQRAEMRRRMQNGARRTSRRIV